MDVPDRDSRRASRPRDARLYARVEAALEAPMQVLAVVFCVILALELAGDLTPEALVVLTRIEWAIWAAFVGEYITLLLLAPDRARFIRTHWADLLVIAAPALRILRIARLARVFRLVRVAAVLGALAGGMRRVLGRKTVVAMAVAAAILVFGAASAVRAAERDELSGFDSFGTALWWAAATITTGGCESITPTSALGRTVALALMVFGIALYGTIAASLAAFFVRQDAAEDASEVAALRAELAELTAAIERIERAVSRQD